MPSETNDRFREDIEEARKLGAKIGRKVTLMEVCGTHTVAICKSGLREILPPEIRLVSGPGCPVCVSTQGYIDACIELASRPEVTVATYGDMLRVPGTRGSLAEARAEGGGVLIVYSALDAVRYAAEHPDRKVVFVAVGFETSAPATALAVKMANEERIENFSALFSHKRIIPAMMALLAAPDLSIDAFICPGHVSVIIGPESYAPVAASGRPCVVSGFEAADVARAVRMILAQIAAGESRVENEYVRAVKPGGNTEAQKLFAQVFQISDENWRGIGVIPESGFTPAKKYARFDARAAHGIEVHEVPEPRGCRCGEVVRGAIDPEECRLFASACNPVHPVGPCMVSREGSCSAHYKYRRQAAKASEG